MSFQLKDLYQTIVESDLDNDNKVELLMNIYNRRINDDLYLTGSVDKGLDFWIRSVDNNGQTNSIKTDYSPDDILDIYKREMNKRRK